MKTARRALTAIAAWAAAAPAAFAATGIREDHSGILVWAFLGMCALIIAAQVVPSVLILAGLAKGLRAPARRETA